MKAKENNDETPTGQLPLSPKKPASKADQLESTASLETAPQPEDIPDHQLGDDQEFFIPIHDFVRYTTEEIQIIDHPAFQRLGKIYQLGQSYLAYRGATHRRLEHALGTVWVAQKIINALEASYHRSIKKGLQDKTRCAFDKPLTLTEKRFVRLAALLHDIGHLPAGHTLEDELGLLASHDANKRLDLVFKKRDWIPGIESAPLGELIDKLYAKHLKSDDVTVTPQLILKKLIAKDAKITGAPVAGIRVNVCRDIVGNTICADLLDYLHRDWYHIGKPRFFDRRLFEYMQIRRDVRNGSPQLVVSYGQRNRPKRDAISSILELLESRYNLGEAVLFHPVKCGAAAMLERGISELHAAIPQDEQEKWLEGLENKILACSDEELIAAFLNECQERKCKSGLILFQALAGRNIFKSVEVVYKDELNASEIQMLEHHYLGRVAQENSTNRKITLEEKREAAKTRMAALASLENDFHLEPGSLVMYCPAKSMNSKIAEVKIIHKDAIRTLDEWDKDKRVKLAGGHCEAQLERFASLWRVEVFMRETELQKIQPEPKASPTEYFRLFKRAVKVAILGVAPDDATTLPEESLSIATGLVNIAASPYYGYRALEQKAARDLRETDKYPLGAPLLKMLMVSNEQ